MKKVTVITGHYGSGKTNISVNLAVRLADSGKKVSAVDLDIVNPYFRTADFGDLFEKRSISLVSSIYANSNLDIPALSFDLERVCREDGYVIIDVGGDDQGAIALGRYKQVFDELSHEGELDVLYVINRYRYLTASPQEATGLMYEIEQASRIKHTGIINNSNLGRETDLDTVMRSLDFGEEVSKLTKLPVAFTCIPEGSVVPDGNNGEFLPVKVYVRPPWEDPEE